MKKAFILICLALASCQVQKDFVMVDGSKSDAIVRMSVLAEPFERVIIDEDKTINEAKKRCTAWGYKSADAFGGDEIECLNNNCTAKNITRSYQCVK